jgi:hypothetical protein
MSTTSICKILDAMKDLLGIGRITPSTIKKKLSIDFTIVAKKTWMQSRRL